MKKIGVIGAGRFGRAFIEGVLKAKIFEAKQIWAAERAEAAASEAKKLGVEIVEDFSVKLKNTDFLLLSVKPAQISEVLAKLKSEKVSKETIIVSVAAGTSLSKLERELEIPAPIVRVMPNSPAAVQSGIAAMAKGKNTSKAQFESVKKIFNSLGACLEIDEKHFDLVTALSGSGPAYFYTVIAALTKAGEKNGLTREQALQLATHTGRGAAQMILRLKKDPVDLTNDVATPGGCTIEALKVLESRGFSEQLVDAVEKAAEVASKLGSR